MVAAAVLLLLAQDSIAAQAEGLAKDPAANRTAILKLGPAAMRPLLELRNAALDGILDDLRLAGADEGLVREFRKPAPAGHAGGVAAAKLVALYGFADPGIPDRLANHVLDLTFEKGSREAQLRAICREAGLDYRVLRGRLVISTAERLWSWPAPGPSDPQALRAAGAALAGGGVEAREAAAKTLLDAGEASLKFIDESIPEAAAVAEKIRARAKPAFWSETLALERQTLDDAGKAVLKALQESRAPIDFHGYELVDAMHILFEKSDVKWSVAAAIKAPIPQADVRNLPTIDALWWLTMPWGYDASIKDGKLVIEPR
jgi:hypothetical protein